MNTQVKVKTLMDKMGTDLWTLAKHSHISVGDLETLMFTGNGSMQISQKINRHIEKLNLCPECLSAVRREGGCAHCQCGWSAC